MTRLGEEAYAPVPGAAGTAVLEAHARWVIASNVALPACAGGVRPAEHVGPERAAVLRDLSRHVLREL